MAAFDGIFRYDGKSFSNISSEVSQARFFSILEDRKQNFWFGSIGSGVYYYDGKSFLNYTTKEGLLNNEVGSLYEDKKGRIWLGVSGGVSYFDGISFRNFIIEGDTMKEDKTGTIFLQRQAFEVNSIIEDRFGRLWFATRNNSFVYDGKSFAIIASGNKRFKNVRTIMEDSQGNIWLAGADGLWRYDGSTYTNFSPKFVGYVMEDKEGNIWTSSENPSGQDWVLSRYSAATLSINKPVITQIKTGEGMIFGILEDDRGNIWYGTLNGVHRYDGKTITDFSSGH